MEESSGKGFLADGIYPIRWIHPPPLEPWRGYCTHVLLCPPQEQGHRYIRPRSPVSWLCESTLGGRGEEVTTDYKDGTEFVKLFLPEGEIDFVASSTLTENPFEEHEVLGRKVLLETPIEIVAKKLWYRGDRATPRDLLDLALVIEHHYSEILDHSNVFAKNIEAFTEQCYSRRAIMLPVFEEIEKIEFKLSFDECLDRANDLKADLLRNPRRRF